MWISKDSLITSYCSNCILWKLESKIQWSFKIFLFNWNIVISKWISWTQAIFKSVSKWLNNWLKPILIFKVKGVYKMCFPDKLPETDHLFILLMFIICRAQCSYWCVFVFNKPCTIINTNSKNAAKAWNYTNHSTTKKRPWRWTILLNFSKENYMFVSVYHLMKWLSWKIKSHLEGNE